MFRGAPHTHFSRDRVAIDLREHITDMNMAASGSVLTLKVDDSIELVENDARVARQMQLERELGKVAEARLEEDRVTASWQGSLEQYRDAVRALGRAPRLLEAASPPSGFRQRGRSTPASYATPDYTLYPVPSHLPP